MKAKLIKKKDGWYNIYDGEIGIGSTYDDLQGYKLSLKNCQAIELGYDLDELACNEIGIDISVINHIDNKVIENDSVSTPIHEAGALGAGLYHRVKGFEIGFQKALELNNTKLYTLEDMMNCWNKALTFQDHKETLGEYIQSLQQTEWDVEVVTEPMNLDEIREQGKGFLHCNTNKPKLDSNGCLILKRKYFIKKK